MAPGRNEGVERGKWGEECAARFLERRGYEIIERNSRPLKRDRRLEIDIVAFDEKRDIIVFVEVKQHARHSIYERRMRSVDRAKLDRTRRACRASNSSHATVPAAFVPAATAGTSVSQAKNALYSAGFQLSR